MLISKYYGVPVGNIDFINLQVYIQLHTLYKQFHVSHISRKINTVTSSFVRNF